MAGDSLQAGSVGFDGETLGQYNENSALALDSFRRDEIGA
jgi:hypothetical protein